MSLRVFLKKRASVALTLYSTLTPYDAFEISRTFRYHGKWSICSKRAKAPFSIFKSIQNLTFFLDFFSMLSKNRKLCHDLKINYGLMGYFVFNCRFVSLHCVAVAFYAACGCCIVWSYSLIFCCCYYVLSLIRFI